MNTSRTLNASRNIMLGVLQKIYQMFIPFLMRTLMIYFMGVQYLGLNSLFTSILQVLNLAELGVGSAMVYSMYKPIAEGDTPTICGLMKQYRTYYRIIGSVIALLGIILLPFIPYLVKGDIPEELNLKLLYLLNLAATVLSYWLFAYKNCLLVAHQRSDIVSKITIITSTFQYSLQIAVIVLIKNYYIYLAISLFNQISINLITAICASKMYPGFTPTGNISKKLQKQISGKIKDLFISKIGGVVLNSVDTIVISAFLGLTVLTVYQNYFFILSSITGLIEIMLTSITASIGNSYVTESPTKNYNDMRKFSFLFLWLVGSCTCCFISLFQPFMKIWVGEQYCLPFSVVICFCCYFFVYEITRLFNVFKNAAGVWHEDRFRPLVSASVNLLLNLLTVRRFGVYGIILSTVIALGIIEIPWLIHNIFTTIFNHQFRAPYTLQILKFSVTIVFSCCIVVFLSRSFKTNDYLTLVIDLLISLIVPNTVYFLIFHKTDEFALSLQIVKNILVKVLKLKIRDT